MIGRITKLISNDYTVKTNENKYIEITDNIKMEKHKPADRRTAGWRKQTKRETRCKEFPVLLYSV